MDVVRLALLIVLLIIVLICIYAYVRVKSFMKTYFGDREVKEVLSLAKEGFSDREKSLSGMDAIYGPRIAKDFPELNLDQVKASVKRQLESVFNAISHKDTGLLEEVSPEIFRKVKNLVESDENLGLMRYIGDISFHNMVVSSYVKDSGLVSIIFQTSLSALAYSLDGDERLFDGDLDKRSQKRYEITMSYIQDLNKLSNTNVKAIGLTCPNCGGPVKRLGQKFCDYCGSGIVPININSWFMIDYREI